MNDAFRKNTFKLNNLVSPEKINRKNLPYILTWIIYYAWVIVFTTWWTASPVSADLIPSNSRTLIHSLNLLFSAFFVVILPKNKFAKISYIGAIGLVVSSIAFLVWQNAVISLILSILLSLFLGLVNASILIPFVFILNNTEKFFSVILSNLLICVLMILQETNVLNITNGIVPSLVILILGLLPIIGFKNSHLSDEIQIDCNHEIPKLKPKVYLTLVLNCLYAIFCKGIGKMFVLSVSGSFTVSLNPIYYIGGVLGCFIYFGIFAFFKKNANEITWNTTFVIFVVAMLLYLFGDKNLFILRCFAALMGIASTMGMINMYYILGVIGKKYNSLKYVKISVVTIGVVGGVTGTLLGSWASANPTSVAITVASFSTIIVVLLLAVSPVFARTYFSDKWTEDSIKFDIDNSLKKNELFQNYKLSPREIEVCMLLLKGNTLRQIAAELKLSYSTINTYQTSLYRKLNVNSKIELVLMFKGYCFEAAKEDEKTA